MKYKLIAVDMDGTLLNDDSVITEHTKAAIISAAETGVLFVVATGRPMSALENIANINILFDKDMPFILFNGATVIAGKSKKILFSAFLGADYVKQVFEHGVERGVPVTVWIGEDLWVNRVCETTREYQKISGRKLNIIADIDDIAGDGVCKMMWLDAPDNIRRYHREMDGYFNGSINCHPTRPDMLEFVSADASKGAALCEIGRVYGINKSEMIAVGDSYNDLSMLEYAGFSVAMKNAPDDIKSVCKYVTLSNNDDGVAAVIEKFVFG